MNLYCRIFFNNLISFEILFKKYETVLNGKFKMYNRYKIYSSTFIWLKKINTWIYSFNKYRLKPDHLGRNQKHLFQFFPSFYTPSLSLSLFTCEFLMPLEMTFIYISHLL